MKKFNRIYQTIYLLICTCIAATLTSCATDPTSYIPQSQRVMMMAEKQQENNRVAGNAGTSTQPNISPGMLSDYYLTLNYSSNQAHLDLQQSRKLNSLLDRIPQLKTYTTRIYAGPGMNVNSFNQVVVVKQRIKSLQQLLQQKTNKVETFYEPNLEVGQINLQFIINQDQASG